MTDTEKQHARQFLSPPLFKTYDAILGLVASVKKHKGLTELPPFTGSLKNIAAKKTGASSHTESRHVKQLVAEGWLIKIAGQRRNDGSFGAKQYRVVLVDEWMTTHPDFVQTKYGKHTNLRKTNMRRKLKKIGIPVEPGVDAVVLLGSESLIPWYPVEQPSPTAVAQPSPSTVAQPSPTDRGTGLVQDACSSSMPVNSSAHTQAKQRASDLCSYSKISKWMPEDMRAATKKRGEKLQIDSLISEHGGAKFLAALHRYWLKLDPNSKLDCKWTAFLESFDGWLSDVTPAELEQQAVKRWRKENPAEYERDQDAMIELQTRELVKKKFTRLEQAAGFEESFVSADDIFGDE